MSLARPFSFICAPDLVAVDAEIDGLGLAVLEVHNKPVLAALLPHPAAVVLHLQAGLGAGWLAPMGKRFPSAEK